MTNDEAKTQLQRLLDAPIDIFESEKEAVRYALTLVERDALVRKVLQSLTDYRARPVDAAPLFHALDNLAAELP